MEFNTIEEELDYYKNYRNKKLQSFKNYYYENKEEKLEYSKNYYQQNKEKILLRNIERGRNTTPVYCNLCDKSVKKINIHLKSKKHIDKTKEN